ncbi:MAG: hypothetical protein JST11_06185 [Acidobacteria bacterium]|nr:hypothetical protein [Acidobacteriota bacterium]
MSITMTGGLVARDSVERRVDSNLPPQGHLLVRRGDIAYNMMRMWQGVLGRGRFDCLVSPAYVVLEPGKKTDSVFAEYLFSTRAAIAEFKRLSYGVVDDRLRLYYRDLVRIPFLVPRSRTEQRKIAKILSTLDETIKQTEALIAKYQQIKSGMMQDLFTRGVTPDGRLRPTRVEAPHLYTESHVGWIPKEWVFATLSECLLGGPKNGYSPREADEWSGVYALGLGCLTLQGFSPSQLKMVTGSSAALTAALLTDGDLLLSRSNTTELVGLCGVYRDVGAPCIYPDLMMRLRPNRRASARFLEALLLSPLVRRRLTSAAVGTSGSMVKLNARSVLGLEFALPLEDEQSRILRVIDQQRTSVRSLEEDLDKLRQLKQGVMQDLLTGRVRVRVTDSEAVGA